VLAIVLGVVGFLMADDVYAHGGSFRGPNGGVPPGLREPSDPEPPPPPPSDPGSPSGPTTPSGPAPGPETPQDQGHDTPDSNPPPAPVGPSQGPQKKTATKSLTFESWRFWWGYNNDDILNLKSHIYSSRTSSSSPIFFSSKKDEENRRNAQRPTERAVMKTIIPALVRTINRPGDNEDIHGGALVALGKVGSSKYVPIFEDALWNRFANEKGQRIDFGYQATESACLALGLLPNLDESAKELVRRICLDALADGNLRTRERCWAAVCLGLQRDTGAIRPLIQALTQKYPDQNVPAGILAGIGLMGSSEETTAILPDLIKGFESGDLFGRDISGEDRTRAFAGYAIMKIGDPKALPTINKILGSRRSGRIVKRSAAIAAGVLGAKAEGQLKHDTVQALLRFVRKSGGDPSGENFALIALSQIGTEKAIGALLDFADNGKYGQRPFAALGLATMIFYNDRDAEEGKADAMDEDLRKKIVDKLIKLSGKYKDADTKAAFLLARGLVKDKTAIEDLVNTVAKKSADPLLRGFSCVSLGLIGDASEHVKETLKLGLRERKSTDLRRDAATGLALLRDAEVVKLLLAELKKAKSFAVQGQLITAIGTIGDHTAIDPLVQILDDRSQPLATRAMAAVGLGMIGDLRPLPPLSRVSKNYNYRASVKDLDELLFIL
jgi:HEAT repeat protein